MQYYKLYAVTFDWPTHQITKKDVDQFKKGRWIPECQLAVQWEREDQKPGKRLTSLELKHHTTLSTSFWTQQDKVDLYVDRQSHWCVSCPAIMNYVI